MTGICEQHYRNNCNSKKILLAMCLGSDVENPGYCDLEVDEFYKKANMKKQFAPTRSDLQAEVVRRFELKHPGGRKKCKSWSMKTLKGMVGI